MTHVSIASPSRDGLAQPRAWLAQLDSGLGWLTELSAAALILVETALLLTGVVARYAFHAPLVWTDEVASILFLWLAMLGAVIALRRGAHMRLGILLSRDGGRLKVWLEPLAGAVAILFLVLLFTPALEYVEDEAIVRSAELDLSHTWRTAAMVVGIVLMAVIAAGRLWELGFGRHVMVPAVAVVAVAGLLWAGRPIFLELGNYNLLIFLVGLVLVAVILGVPIAFAFGIGTVAYLGLATHIPLSVIVSRTQEGMAHLILLSIPLFILLGLLLEMTGMARALVDFLVAVLGHVRCGLSYVLLGAIYLVSGISGSKAADMAAVAPALFPEMKRRGYKPGELVAQLSTSAAMSETIPPSLVLITIGSVTDVSIAALFTGGFLPALVLAVALGMLARYRARDDKPAEIARAPASRVLRTFVVALPALALPVIIRAAVVEGVATATEVATIGIAYVVIAGLAIYRSFPLRRLFPILVETASLTGAILLILGVATAMAWALTQSGLSRQMVAAMTGLPGGATTFLLLSIVAFIILGSTLEGIPALVLFAPLLFPIARVVGIHEVHYAMVIILAMGVGLFAPPLGIGYYTACAIGRIDPDVGMRAIWPYLGALVIALVLVAAFPWLSIGFLY